MKKMLNFCLGLLLILSLVSPAFSQQASVHGFILHPGTGEGIADADVYYGRLYHTISDEDGYYLIENIVPGLYTAYVIAEGFTPFSQGAIEIVEGENEYNFELTCPPSITYDLDTFTFEVDWGGQDSDILTIGNVGCVDLTYSTRITYLEDDIFLGNLFHDQTSQIRSLFQQPPDETAEITLSTDPFTFIPSEPRNSELDDPYFLIFQDAVPWFNSHQEILTLLEIPFDVVGSGMMATQVLDEYTVIMTPSAQPANFYTTFSVNEDRFQEWTASGGWMMWGGGNNNVPWTFWNGMSHVYNPTNQNIIVEPDHPIVEGVVSPVTGTSCSHNTLTNIPENALVILRHNTTNQPTLIEFSEGRGNVIASTLVWEHGYHYPDVNHTNGQCLYNTIVYCAENAEGAGNWLSVEPRNGSVEPGDLLDLELVVDAGRAELLEGIYEALLEIRSDDPQHEVVNIWITAIVGSPGILEGMVTDAETGVGIEDAEVAAYREGEFYRSVFSHEDGHYSMSLGNGNWDIIADAVDYYCGEFFTVNITEGETTVLNLELFHEIPPEITVDVESITFIAPPEGSDSDVLTITNTGGLPLNFSINVEYLENDELVDQIIAYGGFPPPSSFKPRIYTNELEFLQTSHLVSKPSTVQVTPRTFIMPDRMALLEAPSAKREYYYGIEEAWKALQNHLPLDLKQRNLLTQAGVLPPLPELDRTAGPDAFGYYFFDNQEDNGPEYEWLDISQTGTLVPGMGDDGFSGPFPMGFDFPYYSNVYNQIYFGWNGSVGFTGTFNDLGTLTHVNIPSPTGPNNAIQFWQRDMHCNIGGLTQVYYETCEVWGELAFVVEYNHLSEYFEQGIENTISCEVICFESGNIIVQYDYIGATVETNAMTIGIENAAGTAGLEYCYNNAQNAPTVGTAIGYTLDENGINAGWLTIEPRSGVIEIEETMDIELVADALEAELPEDVYEALMTIEGDHRDTQPVTVWLTFIVGAGGIFHPVDPTGMPYPIIIDMATINGEELPPNAGIGVFDGDLCVGSLTVNGEWPRSLITWEGMPEYDLPGFTPGNVISYQVWTPDDEQIRDAWATYARGDGTFGATGYSRITLNATEQQEFTITLQGNYFELISFFLVPEDLRATSIFGNVTDLVIIYQNDGHIYIPPFIDTIGEIDLTQAYQVFCRQRSFLTIRGDLIDPMTQYHLFARRWNWLGYPFPYPLPLTTALSEILDAIIIMQTDDGRLFLPPWINTIGNMAPGEGYFVFVSREVEFRFNDGQGRLAGTNVESETEFEGTVIRPQITEFPAVEGAPQKTGLPYAILVHFSEELKNLQPEIIEVFDGDLLVGKAKVLEEQPFTPIIAWGGSEEQNLPGFVSGNPMRFEVKEAAGESIPVQFKTGDAPVFGKDAYAQVTLDRVNLPTEFSLSQGYPNPFNPTVTIPFALPQTGEISFNIFNIIGQRVYQLNQNYTAGYHRFVFNAGEAANDLVSGVYFLEATFKGETQRQKIMLLK